MAFDIRCPECKAKLRLDEEPDPDSPVECPKCGSKFTSTVAAMAAAVGGGGGTATKTRPAKAKNEAAPAEKPKKGKKPKKKKAKKKKTNPLILLIAIGFGFGGLIVVGFLMMWVLGRAGKVEEMLSYVPGDANWARGVNTGDLAKYPGYKAEVDAYVTYPISAAVDDLAKAADMPAENFLSYLVIAKQRSESFTQTMYVFRTPKSFVPDKLGGGITGATATDFNGTAGYRVGPTGKGILANSLVYFPTNKIIVIVPPRRGQDSAIRSSVALKGNKAESFAGKLDNTGKIVIRGAIWLLVKTDGALKNYIKGMTDQVKTDLPELAKNGATAKTYGCWTTPGGMGVRVGVAMECASSSDARALQRSMQSGKYGKGDEYELTAEVRSSLQLAGDKKVFGEVMQYLDFRTSRECAYMVTKVEGDNAKRVMSIFNNPTMASDEAPAGIGGMGALGPAGVGVGAGGPAQPGLPGGVAPPGIGPGR